MCTDVEAEGKCEYMCTYIYAGVREMKIQMEKESRHMSRVMRTSIGTVTWVSVRFVEQENRKKKWL